LNSMWNMRRHSLLLSTYLAVVADLVDAVRAGQEGGLEGHGALSAHGHVEPHAVREPGRRGGVDGVDADPGRAE